DRIEKQTKISTVNMLSKAQWNQGPDPRISRGLIDTPASEPHSICCQSPAKSAKFRSTKYSIFSRFNADSRCMANLITKFWCRGRSWAGVSNARITRFKPKRGD